MLVGAHGEPRGGRGRAARRLEQEISGARWSRVGEPIAPGERLRELVLRAGTRQLEALLAQRSDLASPLEGNPAREHPTGHASLAREGGS